MMHFIINSFIALFFLSLSLLLQYPSSLSCTSFPRGETSSPDSISFLSFSLSPTFILSVYRTLYPHLSTHSLPIPHSLIILSFSLLSHCPLSLPFRRREQIKREGEPHVEGEEEGRGRWERKEGIQLYSIHRHQNQGSKEVINHLVSRDEREWSCECRICTTINRGTYLLTTKVILYIFNGINLCIFPTMEVGNHPFEISYFISLSTVLSSASSSEIFEWFFCTLCGVDTVGVEQKRNLFLICKRC